MGEGSWFNKWFGPKEQPAPVQPTAERRAAHTVVRFYSQDTWRQIRDPEGWLQELDRLYLALRELVGHPPGNKDVLTYHEDHGNWGALWAMGSESEPYDVGIAVETLPRLLAAINRRPLAAALVHEIGHIAMRWDHDPGAESTYLQWPGAIEGLATPIGAYALLANGTVPSHTDVADGSQDWATAADFANDMINQGLHYLDRGATGRDSAARGGHDPAAKVVEGAVFDLLWYGLDTYVPLKLTFRDYLAKRGQPGFAVRSDRQKLDDFWITLGRQAGYNLSRFLQSWTFDADDVYLALAELPMLDHRRPKAPLPVQYG